ncbi:MAG: oligosaccharide repeat unit polymerase, partial [Bacillota bacterium]|nr:oligosaccharide repeat unit polymerase [Bacillota bacterium]
VIFYAVESFLMGGRLEIIRTFIYVISVVYFLYCYKDRSVDGANAKALSFSKWIVIILPLFYLVKSFIGRTAVESFGEYILRYLGGPLASFEVFINRNISYDTPFGQETFTGIYLYLSKKSGNVIPVPGWIKSPTGLWVGNVYTGLRSYYYDFGFIGTLVMMALLGVFFGYLFSTVWRNIKQHRLRPFPLILYSFFLYSLVFEFFDDTFFSTAITFGSAMQVIIMYVIYRLVFKKVKSD